MDEDPFDRLSWHDNLVYGLRFDVGDAGRGDYRSDLVLDIDHIVEWLRTGDGRIRFRVAAATLVFHDVGDLAIAVDFAGLGAGINELSIDAIRRAPAAGPAGGRRRWTIALNLPRDGSIAFLASGFTQTLRAPPALCDEQRLAAAARPAPAWPRGPAVR